MKQYIFQARYISYSVLSVIVYPAEVLKKHISVTAKDKELIQLLFDGKKTKDAEIIKYELLRYRL